MKPFAKFLLPLLFITAFGILSAGEMRSWTGSNGKIIEAEFLGLEDDVVKIKLKNGREINTLLSNFAEKDRELIKKLGSMENPFDIEEVGEYPQEVLRVTIDINEKGEGKFSLEKTKALPRDEFNGTEAKSSWSEKLKFWKQDDGLQRLVFDYSDDVCDWFGKPEGDPPMLVIHGGADWVVRSAGQLDKICLPLKIMLDVVPKAEGESACIEVVFNNKQSKQENKGVFQFHVYCTKKLLDGHADVLGEWTSFASMGKEQNKSIDRQFDQLPKAFLVRKDGVNLNKSYTANFKIPVSDPSDLKGRFAFGRNLGRPDQKRVVTNPCAVTYIELIGKLGL